MTKFAKTGKYEVNFYPDVLAPHLAVDIVVQSWRNGAGGKVNASCPKTGFKTVSSLQT
jgi:hypothetical protein